MAQNSPGAQNAPNAHLCILVGLDPVPVLAPVLDHSYPAPNGFGSGALESMAIPGAWTDRIWCYHFIGLYARAARENDYLIAIC